MYLFSGIEIFHLIALVCCYLNVEELNSVQYGIDILKTPMVLRKEIPQDAVLLSSKYGQMYQCTYKYHSAVEDSKKEEEEENAALEKGIVGLLSPMSSSSCLLQNKGWWTYEFCFGRDVKQYHLVNGKVDQTGIIYLGMFESDYDWNKTTPRSKNSVRYHSQQYVNGSFCELSGQQRQTEVRFMCDKSSTDHIVSVSEYETCKYQLIINTPRICSHPYVKDTSAKKSVPITCNPLLSEEDYDDYMQTLQDTETDPEPSSSAVTMERERREVASTNYIVDTLSKIMKGEKTSLEVDSIDKDVIASPEEFTKLLKAVVKKMKKDSTDQKKKSGVTDDIKASDDADISEEEEEDVGDEQTSDDEQSVDRIQTETEKQSIEDSTQSDDTQLVGEDAEEESIKPQSTSHTSTVQDTPDTSTSSTSDDVSQPDPTATDTADQSPDTDGSSETSVPDGEIDKSQVKKLLEDVGLLMPVRKLEVKILSIRNKDDKDGDDNNDDDDDDSLSSSRMVIAVLDSNDGEMQEFERQHRMQSNYNFKWRRRTLSQTEQRQDALH